MKRLTHSLIAATLSLSLVLPAFAQSSVSSSVESSVSSIISSSVPSSLASSSSVTSSISSSSVSSSVFSSSKSSKHGKNKKTVDLACMQAAVDKREGALIAALETYTTAWKNNLTTRKNDLKTAWTIMDNKDRREAIRKVWKSFQKNHKVARKAFKDARKNAWKTFRSEAKLCKASENEIDREQDDRD